MKILGRRGVPALGLLALAACGVGLVAAPLTASAKTKAVLTGVGAPDLIVSFGEQGDIFGRSDCRTGPLSGKEATCELEVPPDQSSVYLTVYGFAGVGAPARSDFQVELTYVTRRGPWSHTSWKGQPEKSGGLPMNIGIHFFDLLHWIFGAARSCEVHLREPDRWSGFLELERADVKWYLSVRQQDLPEQVVAAGRPAFRSITIDGQELEFSDGFGDLHTRVYRQILDGQGYGIEDARPSIEVAYRIRTAELQKPNDRAHAWLSRALPSL